MLSLALLMVASPALATQVQADQVPCPLGGSPAQIFRLVTQNAMGGWDSDGASYSTRGQWRSYEVSTCPNYALSLYGRDMEAGLSEEELDRVRPVVEELEAEFDPSRLQVWDRYVMAGRCYQALGRDPLYLSKLYLKASWTARDEAVGELPGLHGPLVLRRLLEAGKVEIAKPDLSLEQRKILLFNLARAAHRGGYAAERDTYMAAIHEAGSLDSAEAKVLRALARAVEVEPRLQEMAMAQLTLVLKGRATAEQKAESRYLIADLLRRTGRSELALEAYDQVAADRKAPDLLRDLSTFLAAELRGERPWEGVEGNPFLQAWTP